MFVGDLIIKFSLRCTGDAETLQSMIDFGADVNAMTQENSLGPNMCSFATLEILRTINALSMFQNHWSPLHEAAHWGRVDATKVLLKAGANVSHTTKNGWTGMWNCASLCCKSSKLLGLGSDKFISCQRCILLQRSAMTQ